MAKPIFAEQVLRAIEGLWNKINAQVGSFFKDASYDETAKKIMLTKEDGSDVEVDLSSLASLDDIDGIVKSVNGQDADATGAVTLALDIDQTSDEYIELTLGDQTVKIEFVEDSVIDDFINAL